jgi:NADH-quinone oxidoreductase subunit G
MAVNEAWTCDKGRFGFTHLTAPQRVTSPQVRGGDGELAEASWAEALLATTRAITASQEQGPGRVAVVTGSRLADEDAYLVSKYVRTVLHSDDLDHRTRFAPDTERDELSAVLGRDTATYDDVESAPVIVVAGLDPEEEVPILHLRLRKAWRQRTARIVVIGPHLGTLAELAWRRVPTRPGGEAAALVARAGSDNEVADALRGDGAPVVLVGERAGAGSLTAAVALADATGGKAAYVPRRAGARGALEAGLAAGLLPGGRRLDDADDRAAVEAVWGGALPEAPGRDLHAILTDAAAGRIDVLHLIGVDLARDAASTELAEAALSKVPLVVCQDLAATETVTRHADVVLPAAGRQERPGSTTNWEGRTQRFARAVDAPDLAQQDWEIVRQLAALLGHDLGLDDLEQIRAEVERLGRRDEPHRWPDLAPTEVAAPAEGTFQLLARPLLLDRGTMLADATDLLATARPATVTINAHDAEQHGIADGDRVAVVAGSARMELTAEVRRDLVPGVLVVPTASTDVPAGALRGRDGAAEVTVERIETAVPAGEVA